MADGQGVLGDADQPHIDPDDEVLLTASIDMVRRCGALSVQVRWSDDPPPTVWLCVVELKLNMQNRPVPRDQVGRKTHVVEASLLPWEAAFKLAESLVDGGRCQHCGRPAGVLRPGSRVPPRSRPICWYRMPQGGKEFVRDCTRGEN